MAAGGEESVENDGKGGRTKGVARHTVVQNADGSQKGEPGRNEWRRRRLPSRGGPVGGTRWTVCPFFRYGSHAPAMAVIPEVVHDTFYDAPCTCAAFNVWGTLLAGGCSDGRVLIWDFVAHSLRRQWKLADAVVSVSFSADGHILLAATETVVIIWGVLDSAELWRLNMTSPLSSATLSKGAMIWVAMSVASASGAEAVEVINLSTQTRRALDLPQGTAQGRALVVFTPVANNAPDGLLLVAAASNIVACDPRTGATLRSVPLKARTMSLTAPYVAVVCADRPAVRVGSLDDWEAEWLEFTDAISRQYFVHAALSADGAVVAAVAEGDGGSVYLWARGGGLLAMLQTKEKAPVREVVWHPRRHVDMLTLGTGGELLVWTRNYAGDLPSSFAPDFEQLSENCEYIEREGAAHGRPSPLPDASRPHLSSPSRA